MRCSKENWEKRNEDFKIFVEAYKSNPIWLFKMQINNGLTIHLFFAVNWVLNVPYSQ